MEHERGGSQLENVRYRLDQLEKAREAFEAWRRVVDNSISDLKKDTEYIRRQLDDNTEAVESVGRRLIGFALSIAASAVIFAISVLAATGKI